MFKIAKSDVASPFMFGSLEPGGYDRDIMAQFCVTESWNGNLSNGVITLGQLSMRFYGLPSAECGLLSLMRCYEVHDRARILELFEQASTTSSSFCFSTTMFAAGGQGQPVFCVGESIGAEEKHSGSMVGVFMFPRFKLEPGSHLAGRQ